MYSMLLKRSDCKAKQHHRGNAPAEERHRGPLLHCVCRTMVKQLSQFPAQLSSQKARLAVKATKEPISQKYVTDIDTMIKGLNEYLEKCEMEMAMAESISADTADEAQCQARVTNLEAMCKTGEHHLGGAKGAKQRFASM